MITFGSVCSGIEAASVAWHPIGWRAAWLAEIEPFPCAVLAHHYPAVPNLGDMTTIAPRILSGEVPAPDVFTGGTPCQAFSVAGKRGSLDDARGNLSLTFCEIANAIDAVRSSAGREPSIIVWENVPGVLSTADNAFGCFLGALAGADDALQAPNGDDGKPQWSNAGLVLGPRRTVAWRIIDAQFFGLAQRRRRVFVVASARNGFDPGAVLFEFDGVRRDSAPRREAREGTARGAADGAGVGSWWDGGQVSQTLDAVLAKGQTMPEKNRFPAVLVPATAHTLRGDGFDASEDGTGRGTPLVPVAVALRGREGGSAAELGDDCAFTLRASEGGGDKPHVLAPVAFSCKDHGADAGELAPTLRAMGSADGRPNGGGQVAVAFNWNAQAAQLPGPTTDTSASASLTCSQQSAVAQAMAVRRLTPTECERLQGFPDSYTAIPWRGKGAESCPDGPRYKALGNSWAVPCARWIGARIDAQLRGGA